MGFLRITAWVATCLAATLYAAPPQDPPARLPVTPAEVATLLQSADEANAHYEELNKQRGQAGNERNAAVNSLRNGEFRKAGGWEDPAFQALVARLAGLETQMKQKRDAASVAEKAGDLDEKAALEIEGQRLRAEKESAQAELDSLVIQRCLGISAAKADAERAQQLVQRAKAANDALAAYAERVRAPWQSLASAYRPKPQGVALEKARVIQLPPPADAERRRAEFARRNEGPELEKLAHRLFHALDEKSPGVAPAFALYRSGKFAAALEAFRDYFLHKLAHLEEHGIPAEAIITDGFAPLVPSALPEAWSADALRGILTTYNRFISREELLQIHHGPPGAVHWTHLPPEPLTAQKQPESLLMMRYLHLLEGDGDSGTVTGWLLQSYQRTGQPVFLEKWAEYADDWALNIQRDLNALAAAELAAGTYRPDLPLLWNVRWYHTLIPRVLTNFVTRLRANALAHPGFARQLSAPTLARVLLVALEEYPAPNILVARATRFNWNMMGLSFNVRNALLLGEFKTAQWLGREAARTLQNHALFSILPDGGYVEYSDEGHQGVWREYGLGAYDLLRAVKPAWFDPALEPDLRASFEQNGLFQLRHLKPDGLRHRDSYRDARAAYVGGRFTTYGRTSLDAQFPGITAEGEPARMLDTVFGRGERGAPRHRSDVMPFLGEFMLRGGWGKQDAFFYMHSGRVPNSNPNEDCNGFKLHNHGHHLLTAQPVYVDGRTQNQHFHHVDRVGAKTEYLTHSDGVPMKGRWHTSGHFDFAEGIYEGAYEDRKDRIYWSAFQNGGFDMRRRLRSLGQPAVTDVQSHARQVFHVRDPECWVVVDRIRTEGRHGYEVPYELYTPVQRLDWLRRTKAPLPNAGKRVTIEANRVRTENPGYPRITLHHFGAEEVAIAFDPKSNDLAAKSRDEIKDADEEWKASPAPLRDWMAFVRRVLVQWQGAGDQVLVTLITTAPEGDARAWEVRRVGAGFSAVAPDGGRVHFAASVHPSALVVDGVSAQADALLVARPKQGDGRGIVLGAESLTIGRKSLSVVPTGAEFALGDRPSVAREIHAPMHPVQIAPEVNVFADHLDVTMSCPTPGVSIHYTLDGSEPTLASPRYTGPVRINKTTAVRAIAVRRGAGELHWPLDPGFATLPVRADFTKRALTPAANPGATRPGLTWEYASGQPFALVATSGFSPAQKSGTTPRLFDVSMHSGGSAFTVRYTGWLEVPADGVYTFHAPREFIIPDCDPGYDLRLSVDGEEWWPAMRRHALGTWSCALAKGAHRLQVIYTDTRTKPFKHETWMNWPNPAVLWKGEVPTLEISGPGLAMRPIPSEWLKTSVN